MIERIAYENYNISLVLTSILRKNDYMNRATTASPQTHAPNGPVRQTSFSKDGVPFAQAYTGAVHSAASFPRAETLVAPSPLARLLTAVMIPLMAGAGWVCLYLWWQHGGAAFLGACALLEVAAFVLLLTLLRQSSCDFAGE